MNAGNGTSTDSFRCEPPSHLRRRLLDGEITMMPEIAVHALKVADQPDCDIHKFADIVECDPKLASDILALANSAAFGSPLSTASVRSAVVRLGLKDCRHLIVAASYRSLMSKCTLSAKWVRNALWRHSVYCGMVTRRIDERFGLRLGGVAFTAGLLHDIGRLLLATLMPEAYAEVDNLDFNERSEDPREAERAVWYTDHCEMGGWFLRHSQLPEEIVACVAGHHEVPQVSPHAKLVALIRLADDMTNHFQNRDSIEGYEGENSPDMAWWVDQYGEGFREQFAECVDDIMKLALADMVEMIRGDSIGL